MARRRPSESVQPESGGGDSVTKPESAHSGRLLLRMPQSLHASLARAADADGVSLNQFINSALASAVSWRGPDGTPSRSEKTSEPEPAGTEAVSAEAPRRGRTVVLTINLVVLLVLAILAIVLLLTAWHQG
jgi:HicB family